jgi:hypothetical protein
MSYVIRWIIVSLVFGFVIGRVMIHLPGHQPSRSQDRSGAFRSFAALGPRNLFTDIVQGIIIGCVLAFITFQVITHAYVTKVNGWTTMFQCGQPGNSTLLRGACAAEFPGPINVPQEAMYWTTKVDGSGEQLSGEHNYTMHFATGQLPPNDAFWSLTMGTARNRFVPNPINRYSVSDRSGLVPNADGSVDIYIQNTAPGGHESNWLPAPPDKFLLWLRVYLPGASILNGKYKVPPVVEMNGSHK